MILSSIFDIIQGHQITDYEIYMSEGAIPIFTGDNDLKGYWGKSIVREKDLPCLSYPTKAFSGNIFLQNKLFDANNTAILIPKYEWRNKINLEWFKYSLPRFFLDIMTSKEGVSYLNREIVEALDIEVPDQATQKLEIDNYKNFENLQKNIKDIELQYDYVLNKNLILNNIPDEEIALHEVIAYISRNDALSEEGIYKNSSTDKGDGTIKVLSGGTDIHEYGQISINSPKIHFIKGRPILRLVTRGKAGLLSYFPPGTYASNTNAFLLFLNNEFFSKIGIVTMEDEIYYLKFLKLYLEPKFLQMSSFADVSVFPLTDVMISMKIPKFTLNKEIRVIVDLYEDIVKRKQYLNNVLSSVENILNKNLIAN